MESVSVGEARSRFSELISRVLAGERLLIRRREKPVAVLISPDELERLERMSRAARQLALALGQSAELLERIEAGEIHPAMAAFGLWKGDPELASLAEEARADRDQAIPRPEVAL